MTKRFFKLFFILSCAVCLALSLAACDDPNDTPSTPETKKYTVTFETNGGSAIQAVTVEQGKTVAKPTDPTKEGNTFDGWYTDKDCTKAFDFKTAVAGNITLYAKWKIKTYTVTFDSNGVGVTPPQAQKVEHGKKATKPAALSVAGHVFKGWFTDKDSKKEFSFDTAITADITLYAGWDFKSWEITFDTKGGDKFDPKKVKHNETVDSLPTPTKSGYIFDCWCIDEKCTIPFDVATKVTENFTLYARWEEPKDDSWTVTFKLNGGSIADGKTTIQVKKGEAIGTLPIPTKDGNTFGGWYEDDTFAKKVDSTFIVTKDITLYAKWAPNTYTVTVTFYIDDVKDEKLSQSIDNGGKVSDPTKELKKDGHTLDGWYSDKECTKEFDFSQPITSDTKLYAKWVINTYTVTFNPNRDGVTPPQAQKVKHGEKADKSSISADGYIFDGWYEKGSEVAFDFNTSITGDITLYAKWYIDAAPELAVATLRDGPGGSIDLYEKGSYKIDNKTVNGYTTSFTIAATNLKKHHNANGTEGYWIGFQLTVDTSRVNKVHYRTKDSGDFIPLDKLEDLDSKNKGFAMYYEYNKVVEKKYMEVYFTNAKDEKSPIYKYEVGFKVSLASDTSDDENKNIDAGIAIEKVTLRDGKTGTTKDLVSEYKVNEKNNTITITATNLKKHKNGKEVLGYWIGFQMVVGNNDFSDGEYHLTWKNDKKSNGYLEDLPNGKGVALYYDYAELTKKEDTVEVYFTNGDKRSVTYKYTVDLKGVTLYGDINGESITAAKLEDHSSLHLKQGDLVSNYKIEPTKTSEFSYNVTISAENLKSHQNAMGESGYWVGFQIAVDKNVWKTVKINGDEEGFPIEDLPDDKKGVALYFNYAKVTNDKIEKVTVQFSNNDNEESEEYTFNVTFKVTTVTYKVIDANKLDAPEGFSNETFEEVKKAIKKVQVNGKTVTVTFDESEYDEITDWIAADNGRTDFVYLQIKTDLQDVTAEQIKFISGYNWDNEGNKAYNFENGTFKFWLPAKNINGGETYTIGYAVDGGSEQEIVISYVFEQ